MNKTFLKTSKFCVKTAQWSKSKKDLKYKFPIIQLQSCSGISTFRPTCYVLSQPYNYNYHDKRRHNMFLVPTYSKRFCSKKDTLGQRKWYTKLSPKYIFLSIVFLSGGTAFFNYQNFKRRFRTTVPYDNSIIDVSNEQYIYPFDPEERAAFLKKHLGLWWPLSLVRRPIAWLLFEKIRYAGAEVSDETIRNFARLSNLLESECNHFSPCLDLKTSIRLARSGADPRLFIAPRLSIKDNKDYYGNKFRYIFGNLSHDKIHDALDSLVNAALRLYNPTETEEEEQSLDYYSGFESDFHLSQNPVKAIGETDFLKICLQGIVSHSRIHTKVKDLLNLGILEVLVSISREYSYKKDVEIMSLVLKILANISCDLSAAQAIKDTGCLKIIAENSLASNIRLALPAKRALHNLDRKSDFPMLPSGIYQLHPEYDCDECYFKYDVIFIHGLLGGVFRTWRRQDTDPFADVNIKPNYKQRQEKENAAIFKTRMFDLRSKSPMKYNPKILTSPDENVDYPLRKVEKDGNYNSIFEDVPLEVKDIPSTPTQCWPRDWLPADCPTGRILAVDFESFVTRWMNICPVETVERKLHDRAAELLQKLKDAGVGQRPIVWVTHSMGGLLLKSLLCQADSSQDPEFHRISKNTKGVTFCSVPHYGTQMVVLNTARRWLFLPTEEIEELANERNQLTDLNECFTWLHEKNNFKVLSFGEILETRTGLGMKFKLVPFASSDIGFGEFYPLRLDHLSTCKPWSRGSFMYQKTVEFIHDAVPVEQVERVTSPRMIAKPNWTSGIDSKVKSHIIGVWNSASQILSNIEYFVKSHLNREPDNNSTIETNEINTNENNVESENINPTVKEK